MLVSTKMITGFNTDVRHEGNVYHVQTEDGGKDNPILESLIYIGGTIVAKKLTPYPEQIDDDARHATLAALLKRQHQVIIAAIKAGRIEDLIRHSLRQQNGQVAKDAESSTGPEPAKAEPSRTIADPIKSTEHRRSKRESAPAEPEASHSVADPIRSTEHRRSKYESAPAADSSSDAVAPAANSHSARPSSRAPSGPKAGATPGRGDTAGLNLDQVLQDYLNRGAGHAKLDVKVLTPEVFSAGKAIGLRVQVTHESKPDFDATVTVKIIGTAFKPQVFIGRVGRDGVASFNMTLPSFSTGTAAIVIEAQSATGHGELKNLIRRA